MIPVILSGGSGTRLWPVSRKNLPKQFMEFFGKTLHSMTLERLAELGAGQVITGEHLKNLTQNEITNLGIGFEVLTEPSAKNTAAAIAYVCRYLQLKQKDHEVVGIFPADHFISNSAKFIKLCRQAEEVAKQGQVVLLGVKPTYAETGYGYIESGSETSAGVFTVNRFHEKPDLQTAEKFVSQKEFLWNGGMFIFQVSTMISLFEKLQPEIWARFQKWSGDANQLKEIYNATKSISIDYAIMEKASDQLRVIPADIGWSDVGSWDAVSDLSRKFPATNNRRVMEISSEGNYIRNESEQIVALVGMENCVVINTPDAILVAKKGLSQNVKDVVEILKTTEFSKTTEVPPKENRPWGSFEILRDSDLFKSKVIVVNSGAQISYQSHAKREEHWIVTRGIGEVVLNDQVIPVKRSTHIHIPLGAKHRIRNTGNEVLEFVEVQIGSYFGEDDIVRYQDDYQRN
ncbi:MAG: mannose-1-phosphate guanylyltransferase/mannose-6-phosphate isomerase [Bdellovibrionota bacterium]